MDDPGFKHVLKDKTRAKQGIQRDQFGKVKWRDNNKYLKVKLEQFAEEFTQQALLNINHY